MITRRDFVCSAVPLACGIFHLNDITPESLNSLKFTPRGECPESHITRSLWRIACCCFVADSSGSTFADLYNDVGLAAFKSFAILHGGEIHMCCMHITCRGWYCRPKVRKDGPCFVGYWAPNQHDKCPCFRLTSKHNISDIVDIHATDEYVLQEAKRYHWDLSRSR